jgi:hypothetical protein
MPPLDQFSFEQIKTGPSFVSPISSRYCAA